MGLEAEGSPDPVDRGGRHSGGPSHRTNAPVRLAGRRGLQRFGDDLFDSLVRHLPRCSRSWLIEESVNPVSGEPTPPDADRLRADADLPGDDLVVQPRRAPEDDAGASRETPGRSTSPRITLEDGFFTFPQHHLALRTTSTCHALYFAIDHEGRR